LEGGFNGGNILSVVSIVPSVALAILSVTSAGSFVRDHRNDQTFYRMTIKYRKSMF